MLVLQKGLILPVPMYGGSYFFIQPFPDAPFLPPPLKDFYSSPYTAIK